MLSVNNITMRFGPRVLFENVTCTFMAGRRYAVTGPNGAGKSTFMKILTGELEGIVGEEGGYTAEADAAVLLDGLGVEASLHERKMGELQGGQKVRVLLAQAL